MSKSSRWALAAALALAAPVVAVHVAPTAEAKDGFAAGDVVEVDVKGNWYPAKVMDVLPEGVWVRFDGYNADYDNVFPEASLRKPKDGSTGAKLGAVAAAATKSATGVSIPSGGGKSSSPASLPPLSRSGWKPPAAPADAAASSASASSASASSASSSSSASSASAPAAVAATLKVPTVHPGYPDIAWHIGDPVEVKENGKWYRGLITNLNYNERPFTVNMELYAVDRWWPPEEVRPVAGFDYAKLPSQASIGKDGAWKEGDQVQAQYRWSTSNYWGDGVVVSVDGDNYYVHLPEGTGTTGENYVWRRSDRVRNAGSTKTGWDEQPDTSGQRAAYQSAIASSGCPSPGGKSASFPFLWYFDHSFDRQVYGVTLYQIPEDVITGAQAAYKCLTPVAAKYSNLPSDGVAFSGAIPTNVQAAFLGQSESIMKKAMQDDARRALLAMVVERTAYTEDRGNAFTTQLPYVDGLAYCKRYIEEQSSTQKMAAALSKAGLQISYPWEELETRFKAAQAALISYAAKQSPSIESVAGVTSSFTLQDAKVEGLAKAAVTKHHPGATVLNSKVDSATLTVIKDDLDRPVYRYKYVATLVKDPAMVACAKIVWRYREDYAGNGAYNAGYVDRFGALELSSIDDVAKCPS